ncbi:MAG: ABC transporter substrate-binding protein, partial [Mariprofundaceae bacterium]|nr:ABC transporter substrate-binding protein [Mariprofundaceae bacterium]
TLAQDDIDLRIVLLLDISDGADAVIVQPGIAGLEDLRGKTIGAESSALGGYMLSRLLEKAGLKPADVQILPLMLDEHEQAFVNKRVDALITFEPVKSRLLLRGGQVVFDSSMIPGEVVDVLVVRAQVLAEHPESLNTLDTLWFRALDYMQRKPGDAAQRMQGRLKLPAEMVLEQYAGLHLGDRKANKAFFDNAASTTVKNATLMMQVMRRQQLLHDDVDVQRLFSGHAQSKAAGATP